MAASFSFHIEGMYAHATPPAHMPITMARAIGPYTILTFLFCLFFGINLALYAIYLHLFCRSKSRDPLVLQLAVFVSVACNAALALYAFIEYYTSHLFAMYTTQGYDVNKIEVYVIPFHTLQGVPVAVGQLYFAIRISKLFDPRSLLVKTVLALAMVVISVQFGLIVWFGAAFYSVGYKTRLLDPRKQHWARGIIDSWTIVFILLESAMIVTTVARLMVLRKQTSMDSARKVIFKLAVYSVQGQLVLTAYSLSSLCLFSGSKTGWYDPLYLVSGALYTMVLLANLIYRRVVAEGMKQASQQASSSLQASASKSRQPDLHPICTYTEHHAHSQTDVSREDTADQGGAAVVWYDSPPASARNERVGDTEFKLEPTTMTTRERVSWQLSPLSSPARSPSPLLPLVLVSARSPSVRSPRPVVGPARVGLSPRDNRF